MSTHSRMDELDLLRAAAPDPGEPEVDVTARSRADLRRAIRDARQNADPETWPDDSKELARRAPLPSGRRRLPGAPRPVLVALALSLVLALAIGGAVALLKGNEGSEQPTRDRTPADPDGLFGDRQGLPTDPNAPTVFLVPGTLPDGFQLVQVTGGGRPSTVGGSAGSPEVDRVQRWVRLDDANERPAEVLSIQWGPGAAALDSIPGLPTASTGAPPDDLLEPYRHNSVPATIRGHEGLYSLGGLVWEEPQGQVVSVSGTKSPEGIQDPSIAPLPQELLQQVAEALTPREDGGFDLPAPPADFEFAAEFPGYASTGTNVRSITYRGPYERGVRIQMVDNTDAPPGANFYFSSARRTEVRGRPALLTPFLNGGDGEGYGQSTFFMGAANLFLQWLEPNGTRVTISGVGLSETELRAIAEGLAPVDQPSWMALQDQVVLDPQGYPNPTGPPPTDEDAARQQVTAVFVEALSSDTSLDERIALVDDSTGLRDAYNDAGRLQPQALADFTVDVHDVRFVNATEAAVLYELVVPSVMPGLVDQERAGRLVLVDGEWKVSRDTVCGILGFAQAACDP
jgi:hypothetical protein